MGANNALKISQETYAKQNVFKLVDFLRVTIKGTIVSNMTYDHRIHLVQERIESFVVPRD